MLEFLNQGLAKITAEAGGNDISFVVIWSLTKVLAFIFLELQMSVPSSEPNHQVDVEIFYWINTHFNLVVVPQEMSEDQQSQDFHLIEDSPSRSRECLYCHAIRHIVLAIFQCRPKLQTDQQMD